MLANLRAALVIARRDYVATVWSRAFILFLLGPLIPILFGMTFGTVGSKMSAPSAPPTIVILASDSEAQALQGVRRRISTILGDEGVPRIEIRPGGNPAHILENDEAAAVVTGLPDRPVLRGVPEVVSRYAALIEWMLSDARRDRALDKAGIVTRPIALKQDFIAAPRHSEQNDRSTLARAGQLLLLFLTMILTGMLLSNMMEEKSSKVIEILAAAVPVDAIFMGKLIAMLGMSLTGIAIWASAAAAALLAFVPVSALEMIAPAVGWPMFIMLSTIYFMASYLLVGALYLGIGAQAGTVREVQTLSMPLTFGQLIVFGFAASAVDQTNGPASIAASLFPWSSPYAMIARAAQQPEIWPHLLAIAWQAAAVAMIVRVGANLFRRSVLKSGGAGFWRKLIGRSSRAA